MKRYYSHYTFIYPDIYLKNHIVEVDNQNRILNYYPFEREVERTEFYSGWLIFVPKNYLMNNDLLLILKEKISTSLAVKSMSMNTKIENISYHIYNEEVRVL